MATCNNPGATLVFGHPMPSSLSELSRYKGEIEAGLRSIPVQYRTTPRGPLQNRTLLLQGRLASNIQAVMREIAACPNVAFVDGGTYNFRGMNNGNANPPASIHSLGLAIDVNVTQNPYQRDNLADDSYHMRTDSHPIVQAFKRHGWVWGGDWKRPDYMHFEFSSGKGDLTGKPSDFYPAGGGMFGGGNSIENCPIDLLAVVAWSKQNCFEKSEHRCAEFVKKAFQAGGATYVCGNGFDNQAFCTQNGFVCIGDFNPIDGHPRATATRPIQFPPGYQQQIGDICLMTHVGGPGHMTYATGPGLDDWVSDFWQRPPGQQSGCGPYCYMSGVGRVQFWRHQSILDGVQYSLGTGIVWKIKNALELVDIPEFEPFEMKIEEFEPDDPQNWLSNPVEFNLTEPIKPFESHEQQINIFDEMRFMEQKRKRIERQRERGLNVDMDTNMLVTGPHEKVR